jgi:LmbE family N-acetylglucosaminyl deacetylase
MRAGELHLAWTRLPVATADTIVGTGRTLILAPHPDDESLGCGGLIAELCRLGRPPRVVVLTDGAGSHPGSRVFAATALRDVREQEVRRALRALGLGDQDGPTFMRLPDTAAPHDGPAFDDAVANLAAYAVGCAAICATWAHDPHCDHQAAHKIAAAAAARTGLRHIAYPVWGWTLPPTACLPGDVAVGWRLDIAASLAMKRAAIAAHRSQHGGVIEDDPNGFALPAALLEVFARPYEVFLAS